jgi:predicted Zn-dependent protease with MMP-like domain/thioredoxin-like negative regulator of GroEL
MDRLNADLERGFSALEDGRFDDAASILERCRRIDRKNPDVIALGAGVADARGDVDEALGLYAALGEARPDDPIPKICLARLTLHDKGEPGAALDILDAAFELIDEDADLVEAVMIRTEALIATNDLAGAREALAELASSVIDEPELALDLGELALTAEDPAAAERWIEIARKDAPAALEADALHLLGRVHEAREDRAKMIETWRKVRAIDATLPPGPVEVSDDELERIASATLDELPANVRAHLERVPILIDDLPSEDLIADGLDPRLLGLFQGSPLPEGGGLAPTVTNILLFRKNLERSATDVDHLAEEIRITVLHETAHYFGLDEDDLEAIGLD